MAAPARRQRPVRTLVTLGTLVAALAVLLFAGNQWSDAAWSPNLALDLEGGTQLILTPIPQTDGQVTSATINQAISVIRQRVDASGVAEAEITSQGTGASAKIVVSLPGHPSEDTLNLVRTSAQMEFRPVLQAGPPTPATSTSPVPAPTPAAAPKSPSDASYYVTAAVQAEFDALDCTDANNRTGGLNGAADAAFVTCEKDGNEKYILGPVEVEGAHISSASSGLEQLASGSVGTKWVVNLTLDSTGTTEFATSSERLVNLEEPRNRFAIVLDGLVVSAPRINSYINNGRAEISGSFTRESAATLAGQLNFGALPVSFQVESEQQISATLGSEQLEKGLLAGLLGLILVVIYSLAQYRLLGMLTVASLMLAAIITYLTITVLSWTQGYRLSLPGVAGIIVAIGITADSFIVYFERIRDELRDGRTLGASVTHGWARARRTIMASDTVNFLAAIVLYVLAVGGVRGFAFTLGLTTIIDLIIVFFFTHPMMEIVSKWRFFNEGHALSGLDPRRLGVPTTRYVGRGKVATGARSTGARSPVAQADDVTAPAPAAGRVPAPVGGPTGPGLTIAERRAASRRPDVGAALEPGPTTDGVDDAPTEGNEH